MKKNDEDDERGQPEKSEEEEREEFDDYAEREILCKAMIAAYETFNKYISDLGLDSAYFSLYLTGYILQSETFEKMEEVRMNLNTTGADKFQYPDKDEPDASNLQNL